MKLWTYQEALNKIQHDVDIRDETFVSKNELAGYFNEALEYIAQEIQAVNQDYFLTKYFVPMTQGQQVFPLPNNILANKIRGVYYRNGSINYMVKQFRRWHKFLNIELTDQYAPSAMYMYTLINDIPGQSQMELHPPCRESAILPPSVTPAPFTPMTLFYIRNCARVPLSVTQSTPGELCNPELVVATAVNTGTNRIQTQSGTQTFGIESQGVPGCYPGSIPYVTGDMIQVYAMPQGSLPAPLTVNTPYYVIATGSGIIQLATSKANALANMPLTLTTQGTLGFVIKVAGTKNIQAAVILDIPEASSFLIQFAKCRVLGKEANGVCPPTEINILTDLKNEVIATLTDAIQDDDTEIQADYSFYNHLS